MASQWFASFKDVAWGTALSAAPALIEQGRKLWNGVAARRARAAGAAAEADAAIEVRVAALEQRAAGVEEEAVSSFDVVRSIAEQHSQLAEQNGRLVEAVDVLLARTRLLLWGYAALAAFAAVLLVILLMRQ